MAKKTELSDEFFVGYLNDVPVRTAGFLKKIAVLLFASVTLLAGLLSFNQEPFSNANFDYGILTTIEGDLFLEPFPRLRITNGAKRESYLLVGAGKMGADNTLINFENQLGNISGKHIKLKGQLIHGNDKRLLQISDDCLPELLGESNELSSTILFDESITTSIEGEIIDPKCFFGVMKPGEGKPHRSCAIRCIAGGIPPVFHTNTENYLLVDQHKKPLKDELVSLVGEAITLKGRIAAIDNWKILMLDISQLKAQIKAVQQNRTFAMMQENISLCAMQ